MKRLLCIMSNGMNRGGAETFLMKIFRKLDKTEYQMDFCVPTKEKGIFDDEIVSLGGKIHSFVPKSSGIIKSYKTLKKIVKENNYQYVLRIGENSLTAIDLIAARSGGAKVVAMRSSNAASGGKLKTILHRLFFPLAKYVPNVKFAPSVLAAEYTFGKNCIKNKKAHIVNNAIEIDDFLFNIDKRENLRKELNLEGKFVIGHVGRFMEQKNHRFLMEVFYEISKKCENAQLLLVGTGPLENEIKSKVDSLNLSDKVSFLGVREDVPVLLSALDVMLMPSFYEGMPNVVIESQAASLHCVISDTITKEANITGLVDYLPLNGNANTWADKVLEYKFYERKNMKDIFVDKKYDISSAVNKFVDLIFNSNKE